jgi:haloalkane dehalogenase
MRPDWLDTSMYPFDSHWLDVDTGRMQYLDEGQGAPVLLVHGTPTWSFLYRDLIRALRDRCRCIAPDLPGFGLSDKPAGASYRPQDQARRLEALIDVLGLKEFALVVHDFGGPIGLAQAVAHPERVRRLVLFNTWMWSFAGERRVEWAGRVFGSPLGRVLYERWGFAVNVMFKHALADRRRYSDAVHRHYAAPLGPGQREATWVYARELTRSSAWYDDLWQQRSRLARIPALLVWGMKDPAFATALPRWRTVFEQAEVIELADVGHAPPEERGPELVPLIAQFLES